MAAAAAVDNQHNNSDNSGRLVVVPPVHTPVAVHSLFVGNLWMPGIPGCSCSTGYKQRLCRTAVVDYRMPEKWSVVAVGYNSADSEVSVADWTAGVDGMKTVVGDNRHLHTHHHRNLHLRKKKTLKSEQALLP